jgi:hypothetical protein
MVTLFGIVRRSNWLFPGPETGKSLLNAKDTGLRQRTTNDKTIVTKPSAHSYVVWGGHVSLGVNVRAGVRFLRNLGY